MNQIPETENAEPQLRLLRASSGQYARGKRLLALQIVLVVALPITAATVGLLTKDLRPIVGLVSLLVAILDASVIDRAQKVMRRSGAKIQESFDSAVLELPWDSFGVGVPEEPETIHEAAAAFAKRHNDSRLRNWYPTEVAIVPLHLARILCQRTNLWYDSKLRKAYGSVVLGIVVAVTAVASLIGVSINLSMADFILSVLAPVAPLVIWGVREFIRQRDASSLLDRLRAAIEALWRRALSGECSSGDCLAESRQFQSAIYEKRASSPFIFNWIYRHNRPALEDQMKSGAKAKVQEACAALGITPPVVS